MNNIHIIVVDKKQKKKNCVCISFADFFRVWLRLELLFIENPATVLILRDRNTVTWSHGWWWWALEASGGHASAAGSQKTSFAGFQRSASEDNDQLPDETSRGLIKKYNFSLQSLSLLCAIFIKKISDILCSCCPLQFQQNNSNQYWINPTLNSLPVADSQGPINSYYLKKVNLNFFVGSVIYSWARVIHRKLFWVKKTKTNKKLWWHST